ncbi:MAG: hypothetical protein ACFFG0_42665 [Candidatus Thorarchaeota archaeon]
MESVKNNKYGFFSIKIDIATDFKTIKNISKKLKGKVAQLIGKTNGNFCKLMNYELEMKDKKDDDKVTKYKYYSDYLKKEVEVDIGKREKDIIIWMCNKYPIGGFVFALKYKKDMKLDKTPHKVFENLLSKNIIYSYNKGEKFSDKGSEFYGQIIYVVSSDIFRLVKKFEDVNFDKRTEKYYYKKGMNSYKKY